MCVYARARVNNVHESVRSSKADRGELLLVFERTGPESVPHRFCRPRPGYRRGTGGTVDARTCTRPPTGRDSVSRPRRRRGGRPWGAAVERAARSRGVEEHSRALDELRRWRRAPVSPAAGEPRPAGCRRRSDRQPASVVDPRRPPGSRFSATDGFFSSVGFFPTSVTSPPAQHVRFVFGPPSSPPPSPPPPTSCQYNTCSSGDARYNARHDNAFAGRYSSDRIVISSSPTRKNNHGASFHYNCIIIIFVFVFTRCYQYYRVYILVLSSQTTSICCIRIHRNNIFILDTRVNGLVELPAATAAASGVGVVTIIVKTAESPIYIYIYYFMTHIDLYTGMSVYLPVITRIYLFIHRQYFV